MDEHYKTHLAQNTESHREIDVSVPDPVSQQGRADIADDTIHSYQLMNEQKQPDIDAARAEVNELLGSNESAYETHAEQTQEWAEAIKHGVENVLRQLPSIESGQFRARSEALTRMEQMIAGRNPQGLSTEIEAVYYRVRSILEGEDAKARAAIELGVGLNDAAYDKQVSQDERDRAQSYRNRLDRLLGNSPTRVKTDGQLRLLMAMPGSGMPHHMIISRLKELYADLANDQNEGTSGKMSPLVELLKEISAHYDK